MPKKDKKKTIPKKPPPKTLEQIISQTLNRRALGHDKLFNTADIQSKTNDHNQTIPTNSRSPTKKTKLADIQFECDTSI